MTDLRTDLVVRRFGRAPEPSIPTLLLLHGLTDSGEGWADAVAHWQDDYAIVVVDARGHGGSPRFSEEQLAGHPGDVMVKDTVHLLEQLDSPIAIGHSLGGAVALAVAAHRPALVRGLVLEDPAPLGPGEPQRDPKRGEAFLEDLRPSRTAPDDEALLRIRREQHPDWPESELLPTGWAEQQMDVDYLARGDWRPTARWPDLFERLTVPTLLVSGDKRGEICVDDAMETALTALRNPQVTFTRVEGAGHCIRREKPDRFYEIVDEWLRGVGSGERPGGRR